MVDVSNTMLHKRTSHEGGGGGGGWLASLASQTLTLHSVLVLSGKTRGGRVWPTAYTRLDPARQDVVWPIRFEENMITSRSMFILRIAGERRGFLEVDLPFGHFLLSKK